MKSRRRNSSRNVRVGVAVNVVLLLGIGLSNACMIHPYASDIVTYVFIVMCCDGVVVESFPYVWGTSSLSLGSGWRDSI